MEPHTFFQWLVRQRKRPDRVGDLAKDVLADECLNRRKKSYWVWKRHLEEEHYACDGALEALREAWEEWDGADPELVAETAMSSPPP
jgi:uncharacterized protein YozE (UPF0346 family)